MKEPNHSELRSEFWAGTEDAMFDRATIGAVVYLSVESMESLAIKGGGPSYRRIGRRALYRKADVLAWVEAKGRVVENTAQLGAAA